MRFAINIPLATVLPPQAAGRSMATIRHMARALEETGLSAVLASEHPAPSAQWLHTDPTAHDSIDSLTGLAMVAASCDRLKVFTNILVLPYRNPFLTAKAAATLQILSDSRLILGVGVGYQKEEFDALGVRFSERGRLTDEALETMALAWRGGAVVKKGLHFDAVGNEPRPVPAPPPPIWVGGGSDSAVRRAARWGDGWAPYFTVPTNDPEVMRSAVVSFDHFSQKARRLKEMREELGRAGPFDLAVAPPFRPKETTRAAADRFVEEVERLAQDGVSWIWTSLPAPSLEAYLDFARWFGEDIIARFAARA